MMQPRIVMLACLIGLFGCNHAAPKAFVDSCAKACADSGQVMHAALDAGGEGLVCRCWPEEKR